MTQPPLSSDLLQALRALDTPTVCNAIELVAPHRRAIGFTIEPLTCLYPDLPPIVGYARTATIRAIEPASLPPEKVRAQRMAYYEYVATGGPLPAISVIQDLDGRRAGFGAFWGEVNSHIHKGLGCIGVITDGSVRDVTANAEGFQMLAGMVAPSHAHVYLVDFAGTVSVAGMHVNSGDIVHADRHGAVVVPRDVAAKVPEAAALIARRERLIIEATKRPDFDFGKLKQAIADASEIH